MSINKQEQNRQIKAKILKRNGIPQKSNISLKKIEMSMSPDDWEQFYQAFKYPNGKPGEE